MVSNTEKNRANNLGRHRLQVSQLIEQTSRSGGLASKLWFDYDPLAKHLANSICLQHLTDSDQPIKVIRTNMFSQALLDLEGVKSAILSENYRIDHTFTCRELEAQVKLEDKFDFIKYSPQTGLELFHVIPVPSFLAKNFLPENSPHWAHLMVSAYLVLKQFNFNQLNSISLSLVFQDPELEADYAIFTNRVNLDQLKKNFLSIWQAYTEIYKNLNPLSPQVLSGLKKLSFPYPQFRQGQKDLVRNVLQVILHKGVGLFQAPTGLGKTLATIYPALRAIVHGTCDAVFYATAMTATRRVVEEELIKLRQGLPQDGLVYLRSLRLENKFNLCLKKDMFCDQNRCPYAKNFYNNLNPALVDLAKFSDIDPDKIKTTAEKYQLCPYELALEMANYCHVVIGDYNHIFSPSARLKNLLDDQSRQVALLVDEAHNLPARARSIYSAGLEYPRLEQLITTIELQDFKNFKSKSELLGQLNELCQVFNQLKLNLITEEKPALSEEFFKHNPLRDKTDSSLWAAWPNFIALQDLPSKLIPLVGQLDRILGELLALERDSMSQDPVLDFFFDLRNFKRILSTEFTDNYICTFSVDSSQTSLLKLECLDARDQLVRTYANQHPVVFFSATLTPLYYYRELLTKGHDNLLEQSYSNPFLGSNLKLIALTEYSMKYADRNESLPEIVRLILDLVQQRMINCLVYVPSWKVLSDIKDLLKTKKLAENLKIIYQTPQMSDQQKRSYLDQFSEFGRRSLIGFAVLASNFNEGIDLKGNKLSMVVVLSTAYPALTPESQLLSAYLEQAYSGNGENYTYLCPGFNRVQQAIGRLIRDHQDFGIGLLIDSRWSESKYQQLFPEDWQVEYLDTSQAVLAEADSFWTQHGLNEP